MSRKTVCIITGSRADYGLLRSLIKEVEQDKHLHLQLVVTGMHLSSRYGLTYKEIIKDGFKIFKKIPILQDANTTAGVTATIGRGCHGFAKFFELNRPDIAVILGDRYEMFAAAIAAYVAQVPIAHIHGGETTQGAMDEGFRHSISKMAYVHFATTEQYCRRIIQLGEAPSRVFCVGAPALDAIYGLNLLDKQTIAKDIGFNCNGKIAIVTYHPVTLDGVAVDGPIKEMFKALQQVPLKVLFTKANADPQGAKINDLIEKFCRKFPLRYKLVDSLGHLRYLSCLKAFDVMVGNSSSGIIEAPSFALPVVNIGDRQKGRLRARNVIDTGSSTSAIVAGIKRALDPSFKRFLVRMPNPYDPYHDGQAGWRIKEHLKKTLQQPIMIMKSFYDMPHKGNE